MMRHSFSVFLFVLLSVAVVCAQAENDRVRVHYGHPAPSNQPAHRLASSFLSGPVLPDTFLVPEQPHASHICFGLRTRNMPELHRLVLEELSNPESPRYGQYLTSEEVLGMVGPTASEVRVVREWIAERLGTAALGRLEERMGGMYMYLHRAVVSDVTRLFGSEVRLERAVDGDSVEGYEKGTSPLMSILRISSKGAEPTVPRDVGRVLDHVSGFADVVRHPSRVRASSASTSVGPSLRQHERFVGPVPFPASSPATGFLPRMVRGQSFGIGLTIAFAVPCLFSTSGTFYLGAAKGPSSTLDLGNLICGAATNSTFLAPSTLNITVCSMPQGQSWSSGTYSNCQSSSVNFNTVISQTKWSTETILYDSSTADGEYTAFAVASLAGLLESSLLQGVSYSGSLTAAYAGRSEIFSFDPFFFHVSLPSEPAAVKQAYGIPQNLQAVTGTEGITVAEFGSNPTIVLSDVQMLCTSLGLNTCPNISFFGPGPWESASPMGEATLDIQTTMGIGPSLVHGYYATTGAITNGALKQFLTSISSQTTKTFVYSMSYSSPENGWTSTEMAATNDLFGVLVAQGYTFVGSSGDDGVMHSEGLISPNCTCTTWCVGYPASSPFVLAVGGTQRVRGDGTRFTVAVANMTYPSGGNSAASMTVTSPPAYVFNNFEDIVISSSYGGAVDSGGGFSSVFAMPSFQAGIVNKFVNNSGLPAYLLSNLRGGHMRGVPDVAVTGHNAAVFQSGAFKWNGGTSFSAPIVATMLALMNDRRVASGLPRLGAPHGFLYNAAVQYPESFVDVVVGTNPGNRADLNRCPVGYNAAQGWDAVSGLGNLDFSMLLDIALQNATKPIFAASSRISSSSTTTSGSQSRAPTNVAVLPVFVTALVLSFLFVSL
eukprot:ANDGO_05198.mRNA.1 Tripeptidyl-peptidase 1